MRKRIAYRKPTFYLPPYNYCDRFCEDCAIDKACCTLFQTGMDHELEAVMKGDDVTGMDHAMSELKENLSDALAMLEEAAEEQGLDLEELKREAGDGREEWEGEPCALLEEAKALTREIDDFAREHRLALEAAESAGADLRDFYRFYPLPAPKLARFLGLPDRIPARDASEEEEAFEREMEATDILSAQIAHRALVETERGFLEILKVQPALTDTVIDFLARGKGIRETLEQEWLARENPFLKPVGDGPWWGPLENADEAVRALGEVRRRRREKESS